MPGVSDPYKGWTYDDLGNHLTQDDDGTTTADLFNAVNEQTARGCVRVRVDTVGIQRLGIDLNQARILDIDPRDPPPKAEPDFVRESDPTRSGRGQIQEGLFRRFVKITTPHATDLRERLGSRRRSAARRDLLSGTPPPDQSAQLL